ncbi:MAG: nucleoside deaminase [Bacteroidales bacterium]|nr:nucleoside deaminase [Bacteroidales bacterium]
MSLFDNPDEYYMQQALHEARAAFDEDEIPVGAVIVSNERIIARAHNNTERLHDVTAHAEMLAFTAATNMLDAKYLTDCTLYVTLEPCVMCAGAAGWTQIGRIVYGASDLKRGFKRFGEGLLHPKTKVESGVLKEDCEALLKEFFMKKRQ